MKKMGYTYDQQKQREIKKQIENQEAQAFLATCPWNQK